MNDSYFMTARVLFGINGCSHCKEYMKVIETLNMKLPMEKKIKVIICSNYYDFAFIDDPLIFHFIKYLDGSFPKLFVDGIILEGARESEELKCFLYTYCWEDLFYKDENDFKYVRHMYNKNCRFVEKNKWSGVKLVCEG